MFSVQTTQKLTKISVSQICRFASTFKCSELSIVECKKRKTVPTKDFGFGKYFTDHMLTIPWNIKDGWGKPKIEPYGPMQLVPSIKAIQYAVATFEGMKAFRGVDGKVRLFRPDKHSERFLRSVDRLAFPLFDGEEFVKCLKALIRLDEPWVPHGRGEALYIRPCMFSTDPAVGLDLSKEAALSILLCPVAPFFDTGNKGVSLYADPKYVRAWEGGCGSFKLSSNYAPALYVQRLTNERNCQTALWLYGPDELVTEAGTMNIFVFWTNEHGEKELITAPLTGLILPGITRMSILELTRGWNEFKVSEREFSMKQLLAAIKEKRLHCMFGTGTACVISPVAEIVYRDQSYKLPVEKKEDQLTLRIYNALADIQYAVNGPHPWLAPIDEELSHRKSAVSS
ncbi:unnamed protein product [Calicophoron daubneyi]|uniref:Branched-chain-amino-acid aminotransferase n=1 Tax=Calicophoron daubneyi TaxID=300641 RepID=A0AAV2TNM9_CALDB